MKKGRFRRYTRIMPRSDRGLAWSLNFSQDCEPSSRVTGAEPAEACGHRYSTRKSAVIPCAKWGLPVVRGWGKTDQAVTPTLASEA